MPRKITTINLEPELLKEAREKAKKDNRSFSNWVENLIKQALGK